MSRQIFMPRATAAAAAASYIYETKKNHLHKAYSLHSVLFKVGRYIFETLTKIKQKSKRRETLKNFA
jgi:hypothetical protein